MPNPTKFQVSWLDKKDNNGHLVKQWCRVDSSSVYSAYCTLCCKPFKINNTGIRQVLNHSSGQKHTEIAKVRFASQQRHLCAQKEKNEAACVDTTVVSWTSKTDSERSYVGQTSSPTRQEQTGIAEMKLKKRKLGERDTDIAKEQLKQETELRKVQWLFQEVHERLQQALKENDMEEIAVVSALMEGAVKKMDEATKKLEDYSKEREVVDSKRRKGMKLKIKNGKCYKIHSE